MKSVAKAAIVCVIVVAVAITLVPALKHSLLRTYQLVEKAPTEELQTNSEVHQIWDSGLYAYDDISTWIFWVDESTLLFKAANTKPVTSQELYLWRLGEKPQPHGEDPKEASRFYRAARGTVCFQQGKIDPAMGASKVLMKGPPGHEQEAALWDIERKGLPFYGGMGNIELIDCEQYTDPRMVGRTFTTDSFHQYYLDRAAEPARLPIDENPVLMRSDGSDRKTLPIPPEEISIIYFRLFDKVFWILEWPVSSKWKATGCLAVWRIDPASASTQRSCIPFGPWSGRFDAPYHMDAAISLVPTAKGLFFTSTNYGDGPDYYHVGASGLYKLQNGAPQRVLAGYLENAVPSPNGCRIAFVYGSNWASHNYSTGTPWTIAAVDLCSSSGPEPKLN